MRAIFEALGLEAFVREVSRLLEHYVSSGIFAILLFGTLILYAALFVHHALRLLPAKICQASETIGPFWQAAVIAFLISNVHIRMIILGW